MKLIQNLINIISKYRKLIINTLVGVFVLSLLLFSDFGYIKRFELIFQNTRIKKEIVAEQTTRDSLNYRISKLLYDTSEIEKISREYYGMLKSDEKIFIVTKKN